MKNEKIESFKREQDALDPRIFIIMSNNMTQEEILEIAERDWLLKKKEEKENAMLELIKDVGPNYLAQSIDQTIYKHSLYVIKDLGEEGQSTQKAKEAQDELHILKEILSALKKVPE